jgi:hypothetical protein
MEYMQRLAYIQITKFYIWIYALPLALLYMSKNHDTIFSAMKYIRD